MKRIDLEYQQTLIEIIEIKESNTIEKKLTMSSDTQSQQEEKVEEIQLLIEDEKNEKQFNWRRAEGILLMVLAAFVLTIKNIIIKYQSKTTQMNTIQAIILRNAFSVVGCFFHLRWDKVSILDIKPHMWKYVFLRGVFGSASSLCQYSSYSFLPLSLAVTIVRTQPILVTINCFIFLKERLSKIEIIGIVSAIFGVILISCPQVLLGDEFAKSYKAHSDLNGQSDSYFYFGISLAFSGALIGSFVFVLCRKVGKDCHFSITPLYNGLISAFIGYLIMIIGNFEIKPLTLTDTYLCFGAGLCQWIQQECQSKALQLEKGGRSAAISYLVIVNAFIADYLLFNETIKITDIAGALLITVFTFITALLKCFGHIN